jgi:heptosyltransferase-2/heptosyltransferase-3
VEEDDPLVCIHPGAGAPVKLWRKEGWARVADALVEGYRAKVILTGSASEEPLVQAIAERMASQPLVAAGQTTLGQLAALMARCRLALGVDSGPLHLAVAVGTPTVHLYGPVDSRTFGPWGDPARHIVLTSDMDCIPCNRLDPQTWIASPATAWITERMNWRLTPAYGTSVRLR